jgi:hypothetical protein
VAQGAGPEFKSQYCKEKKKSLYLIPHLIFLDVRYYILPIFIGLPVPGLLPPPVSSLFVEYIQPFYSFDKLLMIIYYYNRVLGPIFKISQHNMIAETTQANLPTVH